MSAAMQFRFTGEVWFWRGSSPYYFVTVPEKQCAALKAMSGSVTYGWGMIPVVAKLGRTEWKTSLFPKDGRYIVPLKDKVRTAEKIQQGDRVTLRLEVG